LAKTLHTNLLSLLNKVGVTRDDLSQEVYDNYCILEPIVIKNILKDCLVNFTAQVGRISLKSIKRSPMLFWKIVVQSGSQTFQTTSGEMFRCCICRVLKRKGIPYKIEQQRPDVSSEAIDIVLYPGTDHEMYLDLKWSCRERPKQLAKAYSGTYLGYFLTYGTDPNGGDLTQGKVQMLSGHNITSVPLFNLPRVRKKELVGVMTLQELVDKAMSHQMQKTG
jgi:hypothetical protein